MQPAEAELAKRVEQFLTGMRGGFADVAVSADRDTIRLTGNVATFYLRQLAIGGAQRVAGVRTVDDRILVRSDPKKPR